MAWTDLLPRYPQLLVQSIQEEEHHLAITLVSTRLNDICPTCQTSSEDLSCVAARYQRRTDAATRLLQGGGVEGGGQARVRLAKQVPLPTSRSTLLRCTKRLAPRPGNAPRVVGVDDFAWKQGRRYGTMLVDLEAHRLSARLPTCQVETVAAWFRQHPSVLMVTRDRSQAFAAAIRLGAPQPIQIADRFHLHHNTTECLEAVLPREQATLRQGVAPLRTQARAALPTPQPHFLFKQQLSQERRTRRHACYEQVVRLAGQRWSQSAIARELGLHRDTAAGYLKAGQFPERAPRPPRPKAVHAYLGYLQQRRAEGEHNGRIMRDYLKKVTPSTPHLRTEVRRGSYFPFGLLGFDLHLEFCLFSQQRLQSGAPPVRLSLLLGKLHFHLCQPCVRIHWRTGGSTQRYLLVEMKGRARKQRRGKRLKFVQRLSSLILLVQ